VEVNRSNGAERRRRGQSDPIDAYQAAHAVRPGRAATPPKDERIEGLRALHYARRCAGELRAEAGELDPVVDSLGLPQVVDHVRADEAAGAAGDGKGVGDVLLALGVVGGHLLECVAQDVGVESVDARVDLGDGPLLVRAVLLLDDAGDRRLAEVGG
jgi:transposase